MKRLALFIKGWTVKFLYVLVLCTLKTTYIEPVTFHNSGFRMFIKWPILSCYGLLPFCFVLSVMYTTSMLFDFCNVFIGVSRWTYVSLSNAWLFHYPLDSLGIWIQNFLHLNQDSFPSTKESLLLLVIISSARGCIVFWNMTKERCGTYLNNLRVEKRGGSKRF